MTEPTPAQIMKDSEKSSTYWEELAILDFTHEILNRMKTLAWSKTEFAERLNVEPAYVSKLIGGSNNFTLRTMVRLARALDTELRFHLQPTGKQSLWLDYSAPQLRKETKAAVPNATINNSHFKDTHLEPQATTANNANLLAAA